MDGDNDDCVVANNATVGALELEPNNIKPSDRISAPGYAKTIKSFQLALIVLFACFGSGTVFIARNYTAGFYIDFLTENGLNKTFGEYYNCYCSLNHICNSSITNDQESIPTKEKCFDRPFL